MDQTHIHSDSRAGQRATFANMCARLVSDLANPLVIPPFVIFVTGSVLSLSTAELGWITTLSLLFFSFIPFAVTIYFLQSGKIQSLDVPERQNRDLLFRYSILSTSIGGLLLVMLCFGKHPILVDTAAVFFLNPLVGYTINKRFKISIHTAAIAAAGTLLMVLYLQTTELSVWPGILSLGMLLVVLPAVLWSRFRLGVHSFAELGGGVCAGVIFTLIEISLMQMIW